jgi:hypothetical protein
VVGQLSTVSLRIQAGEKLHEDDLEGMRLVAGSATMALKGND